LKNMSAAPIPVINPAGRGRVLRAFGEDVTILLDTAQTSGQFTLVTTITPPGGGPPPHLHENEDEVLYVLEGRVSFLADGKWTEVAPGAAVFAPRKSVHTFKNVGNQPSKVLVQITPSGFENFFAAAAAEFAKPGGPDLDCAMKIAAEHGIKIIT
jgi:quercetin dioxygenase-like cupin family protein